MEQLFVNNWWNWHYFYNYSNNCTTLWKNFNLFLHIRLKYTFFVRFKGQVEGEFRVIKTDEAA